MELGWESILRHAGASLVNHFRTYFVIFTFSGPARDARPRRTLQLPYTVRPSQRRHIVNVRVANNDEAREKKVRPRNGAFRCSLHIKRGSLLCSQQFNSIYLFRCTKIFSVQSKYTRDDIY